MLETTFDLLALGSELERVGPHFLHTSPKGHAVAEKEVNCDRALRRFHHDNSPEKWTRFLVRQVESGMGYQRVDVRLANTFNPRASLL
jgi:hypothetical protein